ncbi:MAG: hypothetical protein WA882_22540 [Geitlerinemataceae cyanobacterium]
MGEFGLALKGVLGCSSLDRSLIPGFLLVNSLKNFSPIHDKVAEGLGVKQCAIAQLIPTKI